MSRVKVTFYLEETDPDDSTGVTEQEYEQITDAVLQLGGDDVQIEKEGS